MTDAGGFGAGLYRLVDYGGTLTDNGLDIGTAPSGYDSTNLTVQTATVGQVNLLVDAALTYFWDGSNTSANNVVDGGTGTWDVSTTNWTTSDGSVNDVYNSSQLLIFAGAAGVVTVDGSAGDVVLQNGMQFAIDGYSVVGDAIGIDGANTIRVGDGTTAGAAYSATIASSLTGSGSLTKTDYGTLVLTGDSSGFTGDTDVDGGTLSITGKLVSTEGIIGSTTGSDGTVTVSGKGSNWASYAHISVGDSGTGTFTISDGGTVSSSYGAIGYYAGSTGAMTVSGDGSIFTTSTFAAGFFGAATLDIAAGGVVDSSYGYIGMNDDSTGTVTVSGAGSIWRNTYSVYVGNNGAGALTIADGGTVNADSGLQVAVNSGSTGTLNIGAAATDPAAAAGILDADTLAFGAGAGTLVFNHTDSDYDFATAISGAGTIDHLAGDTIFSADSSGFTGDTTISDGTVLVDGTLGGSVAVNGGTLGGSGTLDGSVSVTDGTIAAGNSPGTLTIAGDLSLSSGSILEFELGSPTGTAGVDSDLIVVGGDLTLDGTLNVTDAGRFGAGLYRLVDYGGTLTDNGLDIGTAPSGYDSTNLTVQTATVGQVNLLVDAALTYFWDGSNTSANNVVDGGTGTWDVSTTNWTTSDGSVNDVYNSSQLLIFAGAAGVVTVDGSAGDVVLQNGMQFAIDGYSVVGDAIGIDGANTIRVGDGTTAGAAYSATIASSLTGSGSLTKTDYGTLVLTGDSSGFTGDTDVDGGTLEITGQLAGGSGTIGSSTGSDGTVIVTGTGASWTNASYLYLGASGAATLTIENGGAVSNTYSYISDASGSTSTVTVSGAYSTWTNASYLYLGISGTATLTIADGGAVSDTSGYVAYGFSSTGAVMVSGANSKWTNSGDLSVGYDGTGTLTLSDGGTVEVDGALYLARNTGSTGTLNIGAAATDAAAAAGTLDADTLTFGAGTGTLVFNHTDTDYEFNTAISGDGTIDHLAGDTIFSADSSGFTGDTYADGGTLEITGQLGGGDATIGSSTGTDGMVTVTGTGSEWSLSSYLYVGYDGAGTLIIEDGGSVSGMIGYLGTDVGSTGAATVRGDGSALTTSLEMFVGLGGNGTLTIEDGGVVSSSGGYIASEADSAGTVLVSGVGSEWTDHVDLYVGLHGTGTLVIEDGGSVSNSYGLVGYYSGSTSTVSVSDAEFDLDQYCGCVGGLLWHGHAHHHRWRQGQRRRRSVSRPLCRLHRHDRHRRGGDGCGGRGGHARRGPAAIRRGHRHAGVQPYRHRLQLRCGDQRHRHHQPSRRRHHAERRQFRLHRHIDGLRRQLPRQRYAWRQHRCDRRHARRIGNGGRDDDRLRRHACAGQLDRHAECVQRDLLRRLHL